MQLQKGFSLIEGVITVVLFSVLSLIIAPKFLDLITPAKFKAAQGEVAAVRSGIDLATYFTGLQSSSNTFVNPSLNQLASRNGWALNADFSGVCGGNGYAIKTLKADGMGTTSGLDLVASVSGTPVMDASCNGATPITTPAPTTPVVTTPPPVVAPAVTWSLTVGSCGPSNVNTVTGTSVTDLANKLANNYFNCGGDAYAVQSADEVSGVMVFGYYAFSTAGPLKGTFSFTATKQ